LRLLSKPQRCGCQWWPTFAALAGLPTHDATGPTPTDGIDQSDYIMGKTTLSPRTETVLDHLMHCVPGPGIDPEQCVAGQTPDFPAGHYPSHAAGALMKAEGDKLYKLIVGPAQQATWYGHWPTSKCAALSSPTQTLSEQVALRRRHQRQAAAVHGLRRLLALPLPLRVRQPAPPAPHLHISQQEQRNADGVVVRQVAERSFRAR